MLFGGVVGALAVGVMSGRAYDKGYADGQKIIYIHRGEVHK